MLRRRTGHQSALWLDNGSEDEARTASLGRHSSPDATQDAQEGEMPTYHVGILPGPRYTLNASSSGRRKRRTAAILAICMFGLWLLSSHGPVKPGQTLSDISDSAVVTLASSAARLNSNELAITLRSLLRQKVRPREIRLYLTEQDRDAFEWHKQHVESRLSRYLNDGNIHLYYVEDIGPSTKFIYTIRDMLERGMADQPIIVLDDDHSYSPDLVGTLLKYSKTEAFRNAAVGLRGWRVRSDLHWGVPQEELDDHVADGWRLAEPFRVGVLTANEGYLIRPRFFVATLHEDTGVAPLASKVSVLDLEQLNASAVHLVDDIWLNGHLATQRIERYVVPLNGVIRPAPSLNTLLAGSAIPSIDVTKAHTLQGRILREGYTRTTADWVALQLFKDAWRKEDLFYRTKGERRQMTGPEALSCVPRYHAGVASIKAQLLKSYHHIYVRLIFGQ